DSESHHYERTRWLLIAELRVRDGDAASVRAPRGQSRRNAIILGAAAVDRICVAKSGGVKTPGMFHVERVRLCLTRQSHRAEPRSGPRGLTANSTASPRRAVCTAALASAIPPICHPCALAVPERASSAAHEPL